MMPYRQPSVRRHLALASTAACAGGSAYPHAAAPASPQQGYGAQAALGSAEATEAKKDMAPTPAAPPPPGATPGLSAIAPAEPDEPAARDPSLVVTLQPALP
jgi:hypothetical protein